MNSGRINMQGLPALEIAGAVNTALEAHSALIVTAPPGAGKSTVLPLTMLEAVPGKILLLEPRRVAARQVAERMAWLLEERVGDTVGYRIRFESKVSAKTRIEVLTEGILTRRLIEDPGLEGVSAIVFDEFHERSLISDEALALTRQAQALLREDLRIVIMSATLDTEALASALKAPVVQSEGKMFPVEVVRGALQADETNAAEAVAATVREAHAEREGDILAFLPGEADIRRCEALLGTTLGETRIFPLYGQLLNADQRAAIAPSAPGQRKVVLSTPIAETSLTIEGVRVVVDSGLCRRLVYDSRSGLSRLETVRISLDMATQRTGRAGRVAPGVCYRLWSAATEARMPAVRTPEILSADLSGLTLDAAAWGEADLSALEWITPPPAASLRSARTLLQDLGALTPEGKITPHGRALCALGCHPRIAQMLLRADTAPLRALAADIAALLEEKDPLSENREDAALDLRLRALRAARRDGRPGRWSRIHFLAAQYASLVHVHPENGPADPYEAGALVAAAYPERVGHPWKEGTGRFLLSGGEVVAVEPSDPLAACEWIAVAGMNAKPGGIGRIFLAGPVAPEDLLRMATTREVLYWDSKAGAVVARRETRLGVHLLQEKPLSDIPREEIIRVVAEAALKDGLSMFDFQEPVQALQRRVATVAAWHPELDIPDVSTESILFRVGEWLPAFIGTARNAQALKKIDMQEVIWSLVPYSLREQIQRLAPTHIEGPGGRQLRLEYRQGALAPIMRARIEDCFGLVDTPRVNQGKVPVLVELLSPGYKPVQLTSDLRSFWETTYFEVRKELRRRYPKHAWPEKPL